MNDSVQYYPLTPAQKMIYNCLRYTISKSVIDICVMLSFDCDIDLELLKKALYITVRDTESTSIRLHKVGKEIMFYLSCEQPEPFPIKDFSDRTDAEMENALNTWSRMPFPDNSLDTPLYSIYLIHKPNGFYGVYFRVSHLAFDAYALITMATHMLRVYVALRDGTKIPAYEGDYLRMCQEEYAYDASPKKQKDLLWWKEQVFATSPVFNSVDLTKIKRKRGKKYGKTNSFFHSQATHYNHLIPAALVSRVNEAAKNFGVSPQIFYLLALRSYLSRENENEEDVTLYNAIAQRATLLQKRSGGSRVVAIPFRMNLSNDITVAQAIKIVSGLQAAYYLHSKPSFEDVMNTYYQNVKGLMYGFETITLTFNPFHIETPDNICCHLNTYSVGVCTLPMYISIMALDDSGNLNANYDCMNIFADENTVKAVHEHLLYSLEAMIEHPEMTLKQLNSR